MSSAKKSTKRKPRRSPKAGQGSGGDWGDGFRDRLNQAIERLGSGYALAKKLGPGTASQVSQWRNSKLPKADNLGSLVEALGVSSDWLLGFDVPMERRLDVQRGDETVIQAQDVEAYLRHRLVAEIERTVRSPERAEGEMVSALLQEHWVPKESPIETALNCLPLSEVEQRIVTSAPKGQRKKTLKQVLRNRPDDTHLAKRAIELLVSLVVRKAKEDWLENVRSRTRAEIFERRGGQAADAADLAMRILEIESDWAKGLISNSQRAENIRDAWRPPKTKLTFG